MKRLLKTLLTVIGSCAFSVSLILIGSYLLGPPPLSDNYITVLYDNDHNIIEQMNGKHHDISLDNISPHVIDAVLVTEDRKFYNHYGFDLKRILRAILTNMQNKQLKEGASTISQQYARNLYLTHDKTWARKLKEAFYTIRLEMFYSKDDILSGYLNTIYYGHGIYGIEAASQYFFDKPALQLTLSEATMLAGIPKGPTYYSPYNNFEKATERQMLILNLMYKLNKISQQQFEETEKTPLHLSEQKKMNTFASYFEDTVFQEAQTLLDTDVESIKNGGYRIYTTLDQSFQRELENITLKQIDPNSHIQVSSMSMNPETGAILALIGGRDYKESPFNRATKAQRMVGSTFKPILYYTALENGYTPTTMLASEPTVFTLTHGEEYRPKNYNNYYANKPITLEQAMALSDNIYAVKTNLYVKSENVIKTSRKFGIKSDLPNVPSLALGSASISLNDMVTAYGMMANGGYSIDSYTIEKIVNRQGQHIYERKKDRKHIFDKNKIFVLTHLMTGMFDHQLDGYMQVTGASMIPHLTRRYAGKSGTTDYDNWMIGFTPQLVTGVWTGYDDNEPIQLARERTIAKNIWAETMERFHTQIDDKTFPVPSGVEAVTIDPQTGQLATSTCPIQRVTYFERGTTPKEPCREHEQNNIDPFTERGSQDTFFKRVIKFFKQKWPANS